MSCLCPKKASGTVTIKTHFERSGCVKTTHVDFSSEFDYLKNFAKTVVADDANCELVNYQLRALWTAYCFHNDIFVDTYEYDTKLAELYQIIKDHVEFEKFDNFMCGLLV